MLTQYKWILLDRKKNHCKTNWTLKLIILDYSWSKRKLIWIIKNYKYKEINKHIQKCQVLK
jgi:hypothetical protein